MQKDVIYIDIEDDITAVIDKLKASKKKVIALVPPKGNAVLQSTVNLKLLQRAAQQAGKQLVIVTNSQALTRLAGGLSIYIAKTLQSKPAIPLGGDLADSTDNAVEVSDGVGELDEGTGTVSLDESDEVELSSEEIASLDSGQKPSKAAQPGKNQKSKNKVPNFELFRKKLVLIGGGLLLLLVVLLLVFGRTKADIALRAETTPVEVAFTMRLSTTESSDFENFVLRAQREEIKKTMTQEFTPTGEEDQGTKAGGSMSFSIQCGDVETFPTTIPAGTRVTTSSLTFITQSAAVLNNPSGPGCRFSGNTTVQAQNNGDQYNLSARSYSVAGFGAVSAQGGQMSGGTTKIVKVVSQSDVDKARNQLRRQESDDVKQELTDSFGNNMHILSDSFRVDISSVRSEPAVGEEANEGRLSAEATYSMLALTTRDLEAALDTFIEGEMSDTDNQRVYENGFDNLKLTRAEGSGRTAYEVSTLAHYGPKFDTEALKTRVSGKKVGEARSYLQDLPGVKGIDIDLSPFWARQMPNTGRITIKLEVDKNIGG